MTNKNIPLNLTCNDHWGSALCCFPDKCFPVRRCMLFEYVEDEKKRLKQSRANLSESVIADEIANKVIKLRQDRRLTIARIKREDREEERQRVQEERQRAREEREESVRMIKEEYERQAPARAKAAKEKEEREQEELRLEQIAHDKKLKWHAKRAHVWLDDTRVSSRAYMTSRYPSE